MKINKHIFFNELIAPELVEYLCKNNIPYSSANRLVVFDILQSNPHWQDISSIVTEKRISCLSETSFSKKELSEASWLSVRSQWRNGYPQPESNFGYQRITYSEDMYCNECGNGLRQVDAFRMKTSPKWGNRHFMMLNWVFDELFIDDKAKEVLIENGFSGIQFTSVYDKQGKSVLPGVHQLHIETLSDYGLVEGQDNVSNVVACTVCGITKYHPSGIGMHSFYKNTLANMPDVCKTSEIFGWGKSASRLILIRQSVYNSIIENHLDRGLVFAPINLV